MKYNKYSAIAALVYTIVPFISALISNYLSLPFTEEFSFKVIMTASFAVAWGFVVYFLNSLPEESLLKLKIMKTSTDFMKGYWYVSYKDNSYISGSIITICDNCGSHTESKITDYNLDLTENRTTLGIVYWEFDSDERLSLIYAFGGQRHSFLRTTYTAGEYDVERIDDTSEKLPSKTIGKCIKINEAILRGSDVCKDDKLAKKMLKKFTLTKHNIEQILLYLHEIDNSTFSDKVLGEYKKAKILQERNFAPNTVSGSKTMISNKSGKTK